MDEQEKAQHVQEQKQEKHEKHEKASKKNDKNTLSDWFGDIKGEFRKIMWPDKAALAKQTLTVVVTSLLIGVVIVGMDFVFSSAFRFLTSLISS